MLGKLGQLLNKDMGTLVKDAGKFLTTDVSTLAKGAGKVLNADLGTLIRDPQQVASEKFAEPAEGSASATKTASTPESVAVPAEPADRSRVSAPALVPALVPASAPISSPPQTPAAPPGFDPDATLKLSAGDEATLILAPGGGELSSMLPQLDEELVSRHLRQIPTGTSLLQLLPHSAGEFERPHATPTGELTSDPVSAMYSVSGHPVAIRLVQCWDDEEARDRLNEVKAQAGKNYRMADDRSWILGATLQGLVFAWTRGTYSFTAIAPKGEISMVRFLKAFPY